MFRFLRRLLLFLTTSFLLAGGVYLNTLSFHERWHGFVTGELAQHGVHLNFEHLTVNPFGGLVAKGVKVFNDASKEHVVAAVDRLNLDVDFGSLIEGRVKIDGLELLHASVALPVDPERPELTVIELKDLSARAMLVGRQLDIRHAEGLLSDGLRIMISGEDPAGAGLAGAVPCAACADAECEGVRRAGPAGGAQGGAAVSGGRAGV
ncbi:MAG: hypothetical protein B7Z47_03880 [Chthoniobacter sp. 12-60-6]|nr:MAG: hypothetical protein B7Z47_03880 [Chthoniobacter sp. 12-60-6]